MRSVIATAVVLVACWVQPFVEQVANGSDGNMSRLLGSSGEFEESLGAEGGLQALAAVVALPPWWGRGSYREFDPALDLPTLGSTMWGLAGLLILLALGGVISRLRSGTVWLPLIGTALGALAVGWFAAARVPGVPGFGPAAGNYRFLWPIGALLLVALLLPAVDLVARTPSRRSRVMGIQLGLLVIVAGVAWPQYYATPRLETENRLRADCGCAPRPARSAGRRGDCPARSPTASASQRARLLVRGAGRAPAGAV